MLSETFWRGRRVLVTGHAGFKGSWLCAWTSSALRGCSSCVAQLKKGSRKGRQDRKDVGNTPHNIQMVVRLTF